jgi:hypothetical protein
MKVGAIIGLGLGVLATVLVGRYYFLRTVDKSLSVFGLLNSYVFAGIAPDVRRNLHFIFQEQEVNDLQQVVLLIANDGERAISGVIEPLSAQFPLKIEILDASILHRNPEALKVTINQKSNAMGRVLEFNFPLLNKGEFFVAKLLLSGSIAMKDLPFTILADDLPRNLSIKPLPAASLRDSGYKVEWGSAVAGCIILLFPAWLLYMLHLLWIKQPELFPYPWGTYIISWPSILVMIPGAILLIIFGLLGIGIAASAFFNGEFPPSRGAKFPLPKELRNLVFPYRLSLHERFDDEVPPKEPPAQGNDA